LIPSQSGISPGLVHPHRPHSPHLANSFVVAHESGSWLVGDHAAAGSSTGRAACDQTRFVNKNGTCVRDLHLSFLIPLCLLAPFAKAPMKVLFTGPGVITSSTPTGDSADGPGGQTRAGLHHHHPCQWDQCLIVSRFGVRCLGWCVWLKQRSHD
jgi:hypothetical protein